MATDPYISLVFVNYRSVWQLSSALRVLFSLEPESGFFEVIVVNNDSSEGTPLRRLAEKLPFRLLEPEDNLGFGRGANIGAAEARGRILGFLNPDTEWQEPSLRRIGAFFEECQEDCILGMTLCDRHGERERWSSGKAPSLSRLLRDNLFSFLSNSSDSHDSTPDWVSGGGLFISKESFQALEGFDERFFLYFEDVDLCLRARERGMVPMVDARFPLLHRGGRSFSSRDCQKEHFYLSQVRYFEKHRPVFETLSVRLLHRILHRL